MYAPQNIKNNFNSEIKNMLIIEEVYLYVTLGMDCIFFIN